MIVVTTQNFETEVMKSDKPVLVDFFAEWCIGCNRKPLILRRFAICLCWAQKRDRMKHIRIANGVTERWMYITHF